MLVGVAAHPGSRSRGSHTIVSHVTSSNRRGTHTHAAEPHRIADTAAAQPHPATDTCVVADTAASHRQGAADTGAATGAHSFFPLGVTVDQKQALWRQIEKL